MCSNSTSSATSFVASHSILDETSNDLAVGGALLPQDQLDDLGWVCVMPNDIRVEVR